MTGDFAAITGLDNFKNAFTGVYRAAMSSGVVAGMKLEELVESTAPSTETQPNSFTADGKVKIGYVGAYPTLRSFRLHRFLPGRPFTPNVAMEVMYTNSWFDIDEEGAAAKALIANGSVIIGQHADSTGAPAATQKQKDAGTDRYSVGYNIDMLADRSHRCPDLRHQRLVSFYEYLFKSMMNGENPATNWARAITKALLP